MQGSPGPRDCAHEDCGPADGSAFGDRGHAVLAGHPRGVGGATTVWRNFTLPFALRAIATDLVRQYAASAGHATRWLAVTDDESSATAGGAHPTGIHDPGMARALVSTQTTSASSE